MSLVSILPYFRNQLDDLGYDEWRDAFDVENIPENILDRSYHLTLGVADIGPANQTVTQFDVPVIVQLFYKGYTNDDSSTTVDKVIAESEVVFAAILSAANRLGTEVKNVVPQNFSVQPKSVSNTNDMILELNFLAQTMCVFT